MAAPVIKKAAPEPKRIPKKVAIVKPKKIIKKKPKPKKVSQFEIAARKLSSKENLKKIRGKTFELAPSAFGADLDYYDLFDYWHTTGPRNYFGFGNAATDKIIEEIRSTTDDNRRNQLYQEIQEIMYEELPIIFLYRTQDCVAIHKRFDAKTSIASPVYTERRFRLNE